MGIRNIPALGARGPWMAPRPKIHTLRGAAVIHISGRHINLQHTSPRPKARSSRKLLAVMCYVHSLDVNEAVALLKRVV
jgi:hypothetical protein